MNTVNIVMKYNKEHIAATYALLASIIENKDEESIYRIWINIEDMASSKESLRDMQSDTVHIELFTDNKILSRSIKKAIYLQWNTIVQGDLTDLYQIDMDDKAMAAAPNIPDSISYIPVSAEKYDNSVMLIDFSKKGDSVKELPIYYNMAYDQMIQNPEGYDKEKLKEFAGLEKPDMNKLRAKAVILRYSESFSPENYFDHPYSEQWTRYLAMSKYDMAEIENRKAYQGTLGESEEYHDMTNTIPVCFYIENDETAYAVALINSIKEKLRDDRKLDIRILHHAVSEEHKRMLLLMKSDKVSISLHDVKPDRREQALLLVPQLFNNCTKVIWLNSKMICCDDIAKLFDKDISDEYFCETEGSINLKKADEVSIADEMYLENTVYPDLAVVLINVQNWITADIIGKIRYMIKTKREFQKAVYAVCKNHIGRISNEWNYSESKMNGQIYLSRCSIYNYTKGVSPWLSEDGHMAGDIWKYLQAHPEYEKLKDEILKKESGEDEDVKEVMAKIEQLEKQNADLTVEKNTLKQQNEQLKKQNELLDQEKGQFLYELLETRKSFTYKVGRFITFIPRHLRGGK